ncbi:segregation and condensation protein B [Sphingorhabdus sp. SMR4y]|nr:segregation and condensation protein B [Sphingorhabdus sp. SMR4y]
MGEIDREDTSLIEAMPDAPDIGKRAVEATLFAAEKPMTIADIRAYVGDELDVRQILADLQEDFHDRGIILVKTGDRWHFQTAADLSHLLRRERAELRKLSRAGMETLAIIAYHEPVSRAEIESIRGVQVAKGTLDVLMEAGWVRPAGRREVPGRPLIYATTAEFLTHFGLQSRRDLPGLDDLKAAGLLDPVDMALEQMELEAEAEAEANDAEEQSAVRDIADQDGVLLENETERA